MHDERTPKSADVELEQLDNHRSSAAPQEQDDSYGKDATRKGDKQHMQRLGKRQEFDVLSIPQ